MSSKQNHNTPINLENYEEFLILYVDQELDQEQVTMVDDFLEVHPHLKSELDLLMSAKLPQVEYNINKEELFAGKMKALSVEEDLLLYIDNELPGENRKLVELELQENKDYQLQYQVLLKTKLDPSECLSFPHKESLYHHTERIVAFRIWMRVAAAIIVVAALGFLFFNKPSSQTTIPGVAINAPKPAPTIAPEPKSNKVDINNSQKDNRITPLVKENEHEGQDVNTQKEEQPVQRKNLINPAITNSSNLALQADRVNNEAAGQETLRHPVSDIHAANLIEPVTATLKPENQPQNISPVTSALQERNTYTIAAVSSDEPDGNDTRGSVKSFLRKATRLIEKRTGIDPTNEDGELLIGAVAVKLR